MQNKAFFFAGFQSTRLARESGRCAEYSCPTASVLAGNWSAFASPACNAGRTIALRAGLSTTPSIPAQYSPGALALLRRLNQIGPEPCGLVTFGRQNNQDENQFVGRLDYQVTSNQSFFGRYVDDQVQHRPSARGSRPTTC